MNTLCASLGRVTMTERSRMIWELGVEQGRVSWQEMLYFPCSPVCFQGKGLPQLIWNMKKREEARKTSQVNIACREGPVELWKNKGTSDFSTIHWNGWSIPFPAPLNPYQGQMSPKTEYDKKPTLATRREQESGQHENNFREWNFLLLVLSDIFNNNKKKAVIWSLTTIVHSSQEIWMEI